MEHALLETIPLGGGGGGGGRIDNGSYEDMVCDRSVSLVEFLGVHQLTHTWILCGDGVTSMRHAFCYIIHLFTGTRAVPH